MTEWWVSQKKHWCDICKVWTGGHIQQILKHKNGRMHIEHEAKMLEDARIREKDRQKADQDLKDELQAIERAAAAAMEKDRAAAATTPRAAATVTAASAEQIAAEKAQIEQTVAAAKRRRLEAAGVNPDAPPGSPWTRHTDPGSGVYYYYNAGTATSSWTEPPEFAEALAAAEAAAAAAQPAAAAVQPAGVATAGAGCGGTAAAAASAAPAAGAAAFQAPQAARAADGGAPAFHAGSSASSSGPRRPRRAPYDEATAVRNASELVTQFCTPGTGDDGAAPATASSAGKNTWVVCTDPNSQNVYYFNKVTGLSSWTKPDDLEVDLSKAPGPPSMKRPPPPPKRGDQQPAASTAASAGGVGAWEEVRPEESMWQNPEESREAAPPEEPDSDAEEQAPNPFAEVKEALMGRKGMWADEDLELREKEMFVSARTGGASSASVPKFPMVRTQASGIRKRKAD